ncbi:MAG: hypothetical protein JWO78_893 [Micavibrio sp.]|nr:hypothetical protein [Micavibrio sp.]
MLSADEMLANAKAAAAVAAASGSSGKSKVQQLLAGRDDTDKVELSPVAKMLSAKTAAKVESYFDSDDYITAKVSQLKAQIAIYTNLPGLDPSGAILDSLTKDVNDLVDKQKAKLKESTDAAAVKQAELDKQNLNAYKGVSSKDMLSRSNQMATTGKISDATISSAAQAMIDKVSGKNVDKTV